MTSPLVLAWFAARIAERKRRARFDIRVWVAQRIADVVDTCCDIWYSFRPDRNEFWDTVPYAFRPVDVPAPAGSAVAAGTLPGTASSGSPSPALHLDRLRVCRRDLGGCGAQPGQRCVTADGKVTSEHKARQS